MSTSTTTTTNSLEDLSSAPASTQGFSSTPPVPALSGGLQVHDGYPRRNVFQYAQTPQGVAPRLVLTQDQTVCDVHLPVWRAEKASCALCGNTSARGRSHWICSNKFCVYREAVNGKTGVSAQKGIALCLSFKRNCFSDWHALEKLPIRPERQRTKQGNTLLGEVLQVDQLETIHAGGGDVEAIATAAIADQTSSLLLDQTKRRKAENGTPVKEAENGEVSLLDASGQLSSKHDGVVVLGSHELTQENPNSATTATVPPAPTSCTPSTSQSTEMNSTETENPPSPTHSPRTKRRKRN